eukprot:1155455-Pelagomonas_calceolata.AAC.2
MPALSGPTLMFPEPNKLLQRLRLWCRGSGAKSFQPYDYLLGFSCKGAHVKEEQSYALCHEVEDNEELN